MTTPAGRLGEFARVMAVPSEKLVRPVVIEDFPDLGQAASTMTPALLAVLASFQSLVRSRAALQAEVFALRHQLLVLERQRAGRRAQLQASDRLMWVWLSKLWPGWRQALVLVQPETASCAKSWPTVMLPSDST